MVAGVTVRVDVDCNGEQRCVIYEARGYYRTTSGVNFEMGVGGTFTPSPTDVLEQGATHQFDIDSNTYSAMFIKYPDNYDTVMPLQCSESTGDPCLVFPVQKRVLVLLDSLPTTPSLILTGMNNGIYVQPNLLDIGLLALTTTNEAWSYEIPHGNLTTRQTVPLLSSSPATWMTITPTQTPNIFLRDYMNTVSINLYGLYSTTFVKAFYINAPLDIATWDPTYCNATFVSPLHDPYPTRLVCSFINDTTLQVLIPDGVPQEYLDNITE